MGKRTQGTDSVDEASKYQKVEDGTEKTKDIDVIHVLEKSPFLEIVSVGKEHRWQQDVEHDIVIEVDLSDMTVYESEEILVEQKVEEQADDEADDDCEPSFVYELYFLMFEQTGQEHVDQDANQSANEHIAYVSEH